MDKCIINLPATGDDGMEPRDDRGQAGEGDGQQQRRSWLAAREALLASLKFPVLAALLL